VHGVKTRLYAEVQTPPITWHSFSAELGGYVGLGIAIQHADAFSKFTHRAENQLNATQQVLLKHPAHSLDLYVSHCRNPQNLHNAMICRRL